MFDIHGPDLSSLNDEQLNDRLLKLHSRLSWASHNGSGEMINAIQAMIASADFEQTDRLSRAMITSALKASNVICETDPDLAETDQEDDSPVAHTSKSDAALPRISRTTTPVIPVDPLIEEEKK